MSSGWLQIGSLCVFFYISFTVDSVWEFTQYITQFPSQTEENAITKIDPINNNNNKKQQLSNQCAQFPNR